MIRKGNFNYLEKIFFSSIYYVKKIVTGESLSKNIVP